MNRQRPKREFDIVVSGQFDTLAMFYFKSWLSQLNFWGNLVKTMNFFSCSYVLQLNKVCSLCNWIKCTFRQCSPIFIVPFSHSTNLNFWFGNKMWFDVIRLKFMDSPLSRLLSNWPELPSKLHNFSHDLLHDPLNPHPPIPHFAFLGLEILQRNSVK